MIVDLFAGLGGWDLAATRLGHHPVGVETWQPAVDTRQAAGLTTLQADVATLAWPHRLHGLIASPPCQTFSAAGKGAGRQALDRVLAGARHLSADPFSDPFDGAELDDERTRLVLEPLMWTLRHRPQWVAWEQVPTVLPVWEACAEVLAGYGYSAWSGILHAEQYGVPQTRKRAVLIASLDREVGKPTPTHSRYYPRDPGRMDLGVAPWMSMAEALGWGGTARPSHTLTGGGAATGGAEPYGMGARTSMAQSAERGDWVYRRPSTTVVGSFRPAAPGWRKAGDGPRQNAAGSVRISVADALVLQGFPADYPVQGSRTAQYLQVGNAIPPPLAEVVLREAVGSGPTA